MKALKRLFEKPFFSENITLHFYSLGGRLNSLRLNQIMSFAILLLFTCTAVSLGSMYFDMKRDYEQMKSTYKTAVKKCSDLESENALLKKDIEVLEQELQVAEEDMDEMSRYKSSLEKSSFIKSILK